MAWDDKAEFERCKRAWLEFVAENRRNSVTANKYVAVVKGKVFATGDDDKELIRNVYIEFGNVPMYVGRVDGVIPRGNIKSPKIPRAAGC